MGETRACCLCKCNITLALFQELYVNWFISSTSLEMGGIISPLYRWANWGSNSLNDLPDWGHTANKWESRNLSSGCPVSKYIHFSPQHYILSIHLLHIKSLADYLLLCDLRARWGRDDFLLLIVYSGFWKADIFNCKDKDAWWVDKWSVSVCVKWRRQLNTKFFKCFFSILHF